MSNHEMAAKAPYAQPTLTVYGGFSQLTAAGSVNALEGTMMTSLMRRA